MKIDGKAIGIGAVAGAVVVFVLGSVANQAWVANPLIAGAVAGAVGVLASCWAKK